VNGKGGKFNIIPLVLNFATGLALLGIATGTNILHEFDHCQWFAIS
jgi:hypothetical protein